MDPLEQLESRLTPRAKHALGACRYGYYYGDLTMTVRELLAMIERIYGKQTVAELREHLTARKTLGGVD
jgi:hypothetical protein